MSDAEVLRMFRIAANNCSIAKLASLTEINRETLSRLERGKLKITPRIISRLAGFYNISSVCMTRMFRELADYDFHKDYQKALFKILDLMLNNSFK